ncbi:MAG: hypothetical protein AB1730_24795 [Myxococcota bacterium]|jgi:hypothetical protein
MRLFALIVFIVAGAVRAEEPPEARPAPTPTSEAARLGAEYFVQRAGAAWVYQGAKGRGRVGINSFVEWRAHFSYAVAGKSGSGVWRVKDGVWLERAAGRSEHEAVVLPARMTRGTRWTAAASIERGGGGTAQYEVVALEAVVELPNGLTVEHCLAVLETGEGVGPYTHYYAPNMGKVAVDGPNGWVYRLVEFHSGGRGHSE